MADTAYYLQFLEEIDEMAQEVKDFEANFLDNILSARPTTLTERQIEVIRIMTKKYLHTEI